MRLVVLTNEQLKEELLSTGINDSCKIEWVNSSKEFSLYTDADVVIDRQQTIAVVATQGDAAGEESGGDRNAEHRTRTGNRQPRTANYWCQHALS